MIETSASIVALTGAIIKVQGGISGVHKDAANPHFKSRYASLENVIDTARPALQEAKIAFTQAPGLVVDGCVEVTTMLVHESGEWMRSTLHVPLGKRDPQGVGSAITYGCRYSLMAMLGLPPTDDDGEAAMERGTPNTVTGPAIVKTTLSLKTTSSTELKRQGVFGKIQAELAECQTVNEVNVCGFGWSKIAADEGWNKTFHDAVREEFDKRRDELAIAPDDDVFPGDLPNGIRNSPLRAG